MTHFLPRPNRDVLLHAHDDPMGDVGVARPITVHTGREVGVARVVGASDGE
jgi:hypothetical protein